MKVGPDGSLCRITSSAKDLVNNVKIIKVPNSEPSYKLVVIRSTEEHEELSETSDEVTSDDELCDVKFSSESTEKEKVIDTKIDKPNETVRKHNQFNKRRAYHKRNNRFHSRRNDNYNKIARKHKSLSGMAGIYNYGNRDFSSAPSHSVAYIPCNQHPSDDIQPWLNPPLHTNYPCASFSLVPIPEKPISIGLLGDHPSIHGIEGAYAAPIPHFQSNKQNDNYIHDQNSTYSPMASGFQPIVENDSFIYDQNSPYSPMTSNFASNNHNNSFIHNQNSYPQMPSNYPSSKQTDSVIHDQNYWHEDFRSYNKNNQLGNKTHLNNKNNRKKNRWKRRPRGHPNARNNASFDYRNC